ncbi:hypothetical protein J7L87_00785, partial [bacterium]|nr:hypothetical protein [bacterium]
MKKIFIFLCLISVCFSQEKINPAVEKLNEYITFYLSFDNKSLNADLSLGKEKPVKVEGNIAFKKGKYGMALITGKGGIVVFYTQDKNIDLTKPGSLSFWVAPLKWIEKGEKDSRPYIHFFTLYAKRGTLLIERMGFARKPKRHDRLISGFYNFDFKGCGIASADTLKWEKGKWHLIVFNWYVSSFEISVDGNPPIKKNLPRRIEKEDFEKNSRNFFYIGHKGEESTLIDEFTIYSKPLTQKE